MGNLDLHICFQGGTYGNFLRFFINKFSKLTEEVTDYNFTDLGTTPPLKGEGIKIYHPTFDTNISDPNKLKTKNEFDDWLKLDHGQHIIITIREEDMLYLERYNSQRAGEFNVDTNKDVVEVNPWFGEIFAWKEPFKKLYNIDLKQNTKIPRFIIRDFYKLSFLNPEQSGMMYKDKKLKELAKNSFQFPVHAFWNRKQFIDTIKKCNDHFNLQIDINNECLTFYNEFYNRLQLINTKDRYKEIILAIKNKEDYDISKIDTVEQAYISAWIEKNYDYILVNLPNYFFKNTLEIIDWIKHYPEHYKAVNPNLPVFNEYPNPFYLHKKQK